MSVYRRSNGWQVRIDLDRTLDGRRRRVAVGVFPTKKLADAAERKALTDRENGIDLDRKTATVAEAGSRFLREVTPGLSPTTAHRYAELWRLHIEPHIGRVALGKLRAAHVSELYAKLQTEKRGDRAPLSGQTTFHVHRLLFNVMTWAEKRDLVPRNVLRSVDAPRPKASNARALATDEAARLVRAARGTSWEPFIVLALSTGARRGELLALKWHAVDFKALSITIRSNLIIDRNLGELVFKSTKSGRERTIPLSPAAAAALNSLRDRQKREKKLAGKFYTDDHLVFADELGRALHPDAVSKAYATIRKRAGLPHSRLHDLRHSTATWALTAGADLHTVQTLLGHSAPSTTLNVYGHVVAGLQAGAIDAVSAALARGEASLKRQSPKSDEGHQMATNRRKRGPRKGSKKSRKAL